MTKNIKSVIIASAAALAFGAVAVGTTFALFTSKAETNITVKAGVVKIESSTTISSVTELGGIAVLPVEGVYTNSIGGKTYLDSENANILHLEKWAPGDSATIEFRNTNKSNVAILSRFTSTHTHTSEVDLYDALDLDVEAFDKDGNPIADPYSWATYLPAEDPSEGQLLNRIVLTISFPKHDEDGSYDNLYQDADCTFYFTQEAVQGNAYVEANDVTVTFDLNNEHAEEEAPASQTIKSGNKVTRPTDPSEIVISEYSGYTFQGWVDKDGIGWDFDNRVVTEDLTLYATWIEYK